MCFIGFIIKRAGIKATVSNHIYRSVQAKIHQKICINNAQFTLQHIVQRTSTSKQQF